MLRIILCHSQAEAQSLRIPMRLLAVLRESLQPSLPADGTARVPDMASSSSPIQSSSGLDAMHNSLPGIKAQLSPKRRRAAAKAAPPAGVKQQHSGMSAPELKGSNRCARALNARATLPATLNGFQEPAQSPFHGPMKPLRPAEQQNVPEALLNGACYELQAEPAQAPDVFQAHLESHDGQAEAPQEQAMNIASRAKSALEQEAAELATCTEAAVQKEAAEEAACTTALSLALSGRPLPQMPDGPQRHCLVSGKHQRRHAEKDVWCQMWADRKS